MKRCLASLVVVLGMAACDGHPTNQSDADVLTNAPMGELVGLTWLNDGTLIMSVNDRLLRFEAGGGEPEELSPSERSLEGCRRVGYESPSALTDGRLGLVRLCSVAVVDTPIHFRNEFIAVDPDSGDTETIASLAPARRRPGRAGGGLEQDFVTDAISWSFTDSMAIISVGGPICPTLARLEPDGVEPIHLIIGEGARRWDLAEDLERGLTFECTDLGRATSPAESPSGTEFAFFASLDAIGVAGPDRIEQAGALYVTDASFSSVTQVADGLSFLQGVVWVDEDRMVFTAELDGSEPATWLLDRRTGDIAMLHQPGLDELALSPDRRTVAGIARGDGDDQILTLDLAPTE